MQIVNEQDDLGLRLSVISNQNSFQAVLNSPRDFAPATRAANPAHQPIGFQHVRNVAENDFAQAFHTAVLHAGSPINTGCFLCGAPDLHHHKANLLVPGDDRIELEGARDRCEMVRSRPRICSSAS